MNSGHGTAVALDGLPQGLVCLSRKGGFVRYSGRRKGAVLIIVLGVLAVLALLATTFATLQATERQVSRNYMDTVRAKLLAQSGINDAMAQLERIFPGRS